MTSRRRTNTGSDPGARTVTCDRWRLQSPRLYGAGIQPPRSRFWNAVKPPCATRPSSLVTSSTMTSLLDNFAVLDEVLQLVYQGSSRFVVLSHVRDDAWLLHAGLAREGRWWRGKWTENDILHFVGKKSTPDILEMFADRLLSTFTKKELSIVHWDPFSEGHQDLKLIIGPGAKKPITISMTEMTPREAAIFAAGEFASIALQAQSHQCRLYPSAHEPPPQSTDDHDDLRRSRPRSRVSSQRGLPVPEVPEKQQRLAWEATQPLSSPPFPPMKHQGSFPSPPPSVHQYKPSTSTSTIVRLPSPVQAQAQDQVSRTGKHRAKPLAPEPTQSELLAREEIRVLRQELIKARTISQGSFGPGGSTSALQSRSIVPAQMARRGASLANPNKKARRYQAVEFASDSEEE